jgi:hypothetical protein
MCYMKSMKSGRSTFTNLISATFKMYPPECPDEALTRTVVAVSKEDHSMTFAADMPEGFSARLMHGNIDGDGNALTHCAELANPMMTITVLGERAGA